MKYKLFEKEWYSSDWKLVKIELNELNSGISGYKFTWENISEHVASIIRADYVKLNNELYNAEEFKIKNDTITRSKLFFNYKGLIMCKLNYYIVKNDTLKYRIFMLKGKGKDEMWYPFIDNKNLLNYDINTSTLYYDGKNISEYDNNKCKNRIVLIKKYPKRSN